MQAAFQIEVNWKHKHMISYADMIEIKTIIYTYDRDLSNSINKR